MFEKTKDVASDAAGCAWDVAGVAVDKGLGFASRHPFVTATVGFWLAPVAPTTGFIVILGAVAGARLAGQASR